MAPISRQAIGLVAALCAAYAAADDKVLHKDVVIVGGGATGAHAAFRLREDMNKSIALVEKQAILVSYSSDRTLYNHPSGPYLYEFFSSSRAAMSTPMSPPSPATLTTTAS